MVSDGVDKNLLITKKSIFNERSTNSGSFTETLHDCWDLVSSTYNLRFLNFFLFKIQTCFEFSKICDSHSYIYIKYNHWNIYRLTLLILAEEILTFTGGSWCGIFCYISVFCYCYFVIIAEERFEFEFELRVAVFEKSTALNIFQPFNPTSWTNLGNIGERSIMGVILIQLAFKCTVCNL